MSDSSDLPGEYDDQRRFRRRPVLWKGHVEVSRHKLECLVRNVTPAGLLAELDLTLANGVELLVVLPGVRPLAAVVAWSSGTFHGLSFTATEDDVRAAFGKRGESLGFKVPQDAQP